MVKYRKEIADYSLALRISIVTNILLLVAVIVLIFFAIQIHRDKRVFITIPPNMPGNTGLILGVNGASNLTN